MCVQRARIFVDISNVGESSGSYLLVLDIDDTMIEEYNVELESDDSETIVFEYYPTQSGNFTVTVDELSGDVEVKQPLEEESPETEKRGGIPGYPLLSIAVSILLITVILRARSFCWIRHCRLYMTY